MTPEYQKWVETESDKVKRELMQRAKAGHFAGAVYFIPASGQAWARLELADEKPEGATDVIRFPGAGSRVGAVPYSAIFAGIADACHSLPVYPPVPR